MKIRFLSGLLFVAISSMSAVGSAVEKTKLRFVTIMMCKIITTPRYWIAST